MKILYLDCGMGAAGDMLTAALLDLFPEKDRASLVAQLNAIGIPGVHYAAGRGEKCGITGTQVSVTVNGAEEAPSPPAHHDGRNDDHVREEDAGRGLPDDRNGGPERPRDHEHHHDHSGMHDIGQIVESLSLSEKQKSDVMNVYGLIAGAESSVHGVPVSDVHFHEVGAVDAVADVAAVCLLMDRIAPDRVSASAVHVGSGTVQCAHGILPVPAPATAYLLRGIPAYGGNIESELCTPTGAALLNYFVTDFGAMPVMKTKVIGYGLGKKDFERANCLRAFLGESEETGDEIMEFRCNLDDMTGEAVGFAAEQLLKAGALDVYTVPVQMKKSRPGILLNVMCRAEDEEKMTRLIFQHTTTLGVRRTYARRFVLARKTEAVDTKFGTVRKKVSEGFGVRREKYEYDDIARIAAENDMSLDDVLREI